MSLCVVWAFVLPHPEVMPSLPPSLADAPPTGHSQTPSHTEPAASDVCCHNYSMHTEVRALRTRFHIPKFEWVSRPAPHPLKLAKTIRQRMPAAARSQLSPPSARQAAAVASAMMGGPIDVRNLVRLCQKGLVRSGDVKRVWEKIKGMQALIYMSACRKC